MIDLLIVKAAIGAVKPHHQKRLAHVTFSRFSMSNSKPTITFIDSPLTGAQIEAKYWIEAVAGMETAFVELKLPLASATIGQNYIHAGLSSIRHEVQCAEYLVRMIMFTLGFRHDEIERFIENASVELCELTWHTPTTSPKALRSLQKRTEDMFEALKEASSRHDVLVSDVDYRRRNGMPCLLVKFKTGDEFRQYGKFDQVSARTNIGKQRYALSAGMANHRKELLAAIEAHARNEIRLGAETLNMFDMLHPSSWTSCSLKSAIDYAWKNAGFNGAKEVMPRSREAKLSPEAQKTLDRYLKGEKIKDVLPAYTFTRHRQSILESGGPNIAISILPNRIKPESIGYQLQYDRRWEPKGKLRKFVLCEETAPDIITDLQRGIDYLESGVLPTTLDSVDLEAWLTRWKSFAERERVHWTTPAPVDTSGL